MNNIQFTLNYIKDLVLTVCMRKTNRRNASGGPVLLKLNLHQC